MNTKNYAEINILNTINNNVDKINEILASGNFNSQNLKKLIDLYENLYNYTNDINYCKNIADIYYFYFKQKEEALKYYLTYVSKVHNDSFAYHIISLIYKSQKNNTEYKKYLDIALNSSHRKVAEPIPHSDDLVLGINIGVAAGLSMNDNVKYGLETYKKIMQYSPIPNNMITPYLDLEIKKAEQLFNDKNWQEAMIKYKNVFNNSTLQEGDFINLITCLAELKETELAMEYLRKYEESAEDKDRANYVIADLLYFKFNIIPESIQRFERYLVNNPDDALINNTLGHLYSVYYKDKFLDKQLKYFLKAHDLNPNSRTFTRNVALTYNKLGEFKKSDSYYKRLLNINPTHNDYVDYACMLIKNGDFKNGFEYFKHRFQKEDKPALYPPMLPPDKELVNTKQLKNSVILVQAEQGYGDSIMYARFVKELATKAKKVLFVVQNELVDLFKTSDLGAEILPMDTDFSILEYDYHIPVMNLPILLNTTVKTIPYKDKYLTADSHKIEHFGYEFVTDSKKIKIGIAFAGHDVLKDLNRDIELVEFLPILKMRNANIYILQHEDFNKQVDALPKGCNVINVGKDFTTFEDTAAAIMNMDIVITTDNVILNLAGALGVKTFGLFNRFTEYRWYDLNGNDVGWYQSVKPYKAQAMDEWSDLIDQIKLDLKNI